MVKYTDETLKQLHSTILEMLIEFDRICRKYNIPYIIESEHCWELLEIKDLLSGTMMQI